MQEKTKESKAKQERNKAKQSNKRKHTKPSKRKAQLAKMQGEQTDVHKEFLLYDAKRMQDKYGQSWGAEVELLKQVAASAVKLSGDVSNLLKQHEVRTAVAKQVVSSDRKRKPKKTSSGGLATE